MILLVTGGRAFFDRLYVWNTLDEYHEEHHVTHLVHGDASGVDTISRKWAEARGIKQTPFPIFRASGEDGYARNLRMFLHARPDRVLAFPGASGTADMVRIARTYQVPVKRAIT